MVKLKLFVDGGVRTGGVNGPSGGVSGPAAIGCVIRSDDDTILEQDGMHIGEATNNEAEYSAVIRGLALCLKMGAAEVDVYSDSQLVVNQLRGAWVVRKPHIQEYWQEVIEEVQRFNRVSFTWIPRERNTLADQITRDILG